MNKDPRIGETVSHFKILSQLGRGGMGIVYKAEDTELQRLVALKFMPANLLLDEQSKKRFKLEARAAAKLEHRRIGAIYETGETGGGELFIAMAYYDGDTLKQRIGQDRLSLEEAVRLTRQIADGLKEAHDNGILHRDIKPANIIFDKDNYVKIVDFGLAKLGGLTQITQPGTSMGTPGYMSPEQARGAEVDQRCDIWALCVIFYEMLTGRLPFKGHDNMSMLYNIVNEPPTPIREHGHNLPVKCQEIFDKAFSKKIDERYSNIQELLEDIDRIPIARPADQDAMETVLLQPRIQTGPAAQADSGKKSRLSKAALSLAAVIVAIIGGVNYFNQAPDPQPETTVAQVTPAPQDNQTRTDREMPDTTAATTEALTAPEEISQTSQVSTAGKRLASRVPLGETSKKAAIPRKASARKKSPPQAQPQTEIAEPVTATPQFGSLVVTSQPPGADIYLNDSLSSQKTPFKFAKLKAGSYEIRLLLPGYVADSTQVDLPPAGAKTENLVLAEPLKATVTITAVIQNGRGESFAVADIFIDGQPRGQTPKTLSVKSGAHVIEAKLFGYDPQKSLLAVDNGDPQNIKFVFSRK